ncbi:MAG: 30S ribosomal protein S8 [Candidatus Wildermuthbacteria bacterium]|nr:30S ribosomal protein S8 [Candidatus Wildermuthbacteria bacterium]
MIDPIADMLTRIRNGQLVLKDQVSVPFSRVKFEIAKVLEGEGFVRAAEIRGRKGRKEIEVNLKYEDKIPAISGVRRVSKPGQRIYASISEMGRVKRGGGVVIVSTSKGIMADKEARKQNIGGEVLCEIW